MKIIRCRYWRYCHWVHFFHTLMATPPIPASNYLYQYWLKFYDLTWSIIYSLRPTCTHLDLKIWVGSCEDNWVRFFHKVMAIPSTPASNYLHKYCFKFYDLTLRVIYSLRTTCTHLDLKIWVSGCRDNCVRFFLILMALFLCTCIDFLHQYSMYSGRKAFLVLYSWRAT